MTAPNEHLSVDGGDLAFDDSGGAGAPVVCAPGMGDIRTVYRFVRPELIRRGFRVLTLDLRGMGGSSVRWPSYSARDIADDLARLVTMRVGRPAVLIGNSVSAGAAVWLAATRSDLVSRLVLISPFLRRPHLSLLKRFLFRAALARPWGPTAWGGYMESRLYPARRPADMASYRAALERNLREPGRMRAFQRMAFTDHHPEALDADRVRVPTLIVYGGADPDFDDPRDEGAYAKRLTSACVEVIEGAGHYPQAEMPERFNAVLVPFLEGA